MRLDTNEQASQFTPGGERTPRNEDLTHHDLIITFHLGALEVLTSDTATRRRGGAGLHS